MYCPNCGKENSEIQRFCRSCGLSLQAVSLALANELSEKTQTDDHLLEITNPVQKKLQNPLVYGWLIIMLGVVIGVFGKSILLDKTIADIGTLMAVLGIGIIGLKGVLLVAQEPKLLPQQPKALPAGEPTAKLPPVLHSGEPASITEPTTKLLETGRENAQERSRTTKPS